MMGEINELQKEIHKIAIVKGWWEENDRKFPEIIALCHSELSEALEDYRLGMGINQIVEIDGKKEGIPIELADVIIRILDFCGYAEIDIENAIKQKIEYNKTRPYRHGNKKA